jgi:hypothetical protein
MSNVKILWRRGFDSFVFCLLETDHGQFTILNESVPLTDSDSHQPIEGQHHDRPTQP